MAKNILFVSSNKYIKPEVQELVSELQSKVFVVNTIDEAINCLAMESIDIFVYHAYNFNDLAMLEFIQNQYKDLRMIIRCEPNIKSAISFIRNNHVDFLAESYLAEGLKAIFT